MGLGEAAEQWVEVLLTPGNEQEHESPGGVGRDRHKVEMNPHWLKPRGDTTVTVTGPLDWEPTKSRVQSIGAAHTLVRKQVNNPVENKAKDRKRQLTVLETQINQKHAEMLISFGIRENAA